MADVLGAFADRGEEAGAAQRFYAAVAEVTEADVRAVLDLLLEEEPAVVEVPPQRLPRS
jgi:rubrerythrin